MKGRMDDFVFDENYDKWPPGIFESSEVIRGNPLLADKKWDLGILVGIEDAAMTGSFMAKKYRERHPELLKKKKAMN